MKRFSILFAFLVSFQFVSVASAADSVEMALAGRHMTITNEELEKLAGGEDALVKRLLELRTADTLPQVSVRAERFLLSYAERSDVQEALLSDVSSPNTTGLARAVAFHIDKVEDSAARQKLARSIVNRGQREKAFLPYARHLTNSQDASVSRLARESLPTE